MSNGSTSLIIIQPTPFCNIDCAYCYLPLRNDRTTLSLDQIDLIFTKLLAFPTVSGRVTVVWHAGEPLVLGPDYYEAAFERIKERQPDGLIVDHAFQTNGILINDSWCDLFERWKVGVGVSVDGPEHIHDTARKTRSGRGTHRKTVAGIEHLRRRSIPFYVISVLTRAAMMDPSGMFSFYRDQDIREVGFNIEEQEGIHVTSTLSSGGDKDNVLSFFRRFSELMKENEFPIVVREFEETLISIRYFNNAGPINNLVIPFGLITVDVHGHVYTFSPELAGYSSPDFETFSLGNIFDADFNDLENSSVLTAMRAQIDHGISLCRAECSYFSMCGGGVPSNKLFENGTFASTETMYCRITKKYVTDFLLSTIEERGNCLTNRA
jgi:uncharacterized protein